MNTLFSKCLRHLFLYTLALFCFSPLYSTKAKETSTFFFTPIVSTMYSDTVLIKSPRLLQEGEAQRLHCDQQLSDGTFTFAQITQTWDTIVLTLGVQPNTTYRCAVEVVEDKILLSIDDDYTSLGKSNTVTFTTPDKGTEQNRPFITLTQMYGPIHVEYLYGDSALLTAGTFPIKGEYYGYTCEQLTGENAFSNTLRGKAKDGNTRSIMITHLLPETQYQCYFNVYMESNPSFDGRSEPVVFTTTKVFTKYEDLVNKKKVSTENPFPDTSLTTLTGKAALELFQRNVLGGYPDGEFKGTRTVNRAEAAKFLLLTKNIGTEETKNNGQFTDVVDGAWYIPFVVTAAGKGIIEGYSDHTFRPSNTVNTAEFLKMLTLTFGLKMYLPYQYTDVPKDSWFSGYAGIAEKYDLFPYRSKQELSPASLLSREEVAVALYQYLSNR